MSANEMVLQDLDNGLADHHHEPPGPAQCAQPGHDARPGGGGAARGGGSRGARGADQGRGRHVLRRRRRQVDGGRAAAPLPFEAKMRQPAPRHGSVAHPAPDAEAGGGAARRCGRRRRPLDRAVLRPARRQRIRARSPRRSPRSAFRRLRRHLFPDPDARQRQGARALSDVAGAVSAGSAGDSAW